MGFDPAARDTYLRQVGEFDEKAKRLGLGEVEFYWYHTVELGGGLVTPGSYDYRSNLADFRFPERMEGMRVLDVGSATGFFAFEFERRGAEVTSVEIPSLADLDRFPGQSVEQSIKKIDRLLGSHAPEGRQTSFRNYTANAYYHFLLDGPFQFCHKALGSRVRRCYSTIYNLSPETLGRDGFDLIFIGDVLLHTIAPLQALAAVGPLCRGTLIIAQALPEPDDGRPAMVYVGGDDLEGDEVSWWLPNKQCFMQMLKKLGFGKVEDVGRHEVVLRPAGYTFSRTVLHATL